VTLTGTLFFCVCFGLAGTDITVSFEGLFWIFSAISLIGRQGARGVVSAIIIVQFFKIIQPCLMNVRNAMTRRLNRSEGTRDQIMQSNAGLHSGHSEKVY
jgi:hypothetical protein